MNTFPVPSASKAPLDFVVVLHTHMPHVMRHGRWPHGSDWLMDAVIDSYLPLIDGAQRLAPGAGEGAADREHHADTGRLAR